MVKARFDIMCSSRQACPEVMDSLRHMDFENVDEIFDNPTYDITATIEIKNEQHMDHLIKELDKKAHGKIKQVAITT